MTDNEYVCKKLGIPWHVWSGALKTIRIDESAHEICICGKIDCDEENPDFAADPARLLREMMKRDDWDAFQIFINQCGKVKYGYVWINYITEPGLLLKAVAEWLKKEKEG